MGSRSSGAFQAVHDLLQGQRLLREPTELTEAPEVGAAPACDPDGTANRNERIELIWP